MEITRSNALMASDYKVILCAENTPVDQTIHSDVTHFLKGEEDFMVVKTMTSATFFVRLQEDREKNRASGAKVRKELPKSCETIAVLGEETAVADLLEGLLLSNYQFLKYFSDASKRAYALRQILVDTSFSASSEKEVLAIAKAVYWARDMVNEPVSFLNAEQLAEEIKALASVAPLDVKVLEKTQIESLKMGGLLAVNQGSMDPPTFTIIEYKPQNAINKQPIVLVGKGVVYDTGGLSLKPTPNSMDIMKSDMGGAACVGGAIFLSAMQQLPLHLIALVPATDNRPGFNAYAPGDVVEMYNGLKVEVLNTDAEGRMILADALSYSEKYNPQLVIDAATLTGAAHRAVGEHGVVIMGNAPENYFETFSKAGEESYERLVRFPFWEEYGEELKSPIADLKNLGGPTAGMITAGKFLERFTKSPYIHLDIAGPAWLDKDSAYRTKGGSGVGVRLLYHFLKNLTIDGKH